MTDEIEALMARARQLEEDNTLLRSMQSPGTDQAGAQTAAAPAAPAGAPPAAADASAPAAVGPGGPQAGGAVPAEPALPKTLAEFNALPPAQRQLMARRMTRQQRDELLGRGDGRQGRECYL